MFVCTFLCEIYRSGCVPFADSQSGSLLYAKINCTFLLHKAETALFTTYIRRGKKQLSTKLGQNWKIQMQILPYFWKWGLLDLGFGPRIVKRFFLKKKNYRLEVFLSLVNSLMVTSHTAKAFLSFIVWHARSSTASPSWTILKSAELLYSTF